MIIPKNIKILSIGLSLSIFVISLTQNAFIVEATDGPRTDSSIECFLMGSTAIIGGGMLEWFIWLANPLSLIAVFLFCYDNRYAVRLTLIAFLLALSFLLWNKVLINEGGSTGKILSLESGYYLWLASITILTSSIIFYFQKYRKINPSKEFVNEVKSSNLEQLNGKYKF